MSMIELDKGLAGYLEKDVDVVAASSKDWEPEYLALSHLVDIFRRLSDLIEIKDKNLHIPARLFLVVLNQSYGVASELLRRRTSDAQALARRAVEAAGITHRIWHHSELIQVFNKAYPDINDSEHPKQFRPSNEYRSQFSYDQLFAGDSPALKRLESLIELFSMGATHAGIGALVGQKWEDSVLKLSQRETDRVKIGRAWVSVITAYWEMLRVFFAILKSSVRDGMAEAVEADMKKWLEKYIGTFKERAFWIPKLHEPTW